MLGQTRYLAIKQGIVDPVRGVLAAGLLYFIHAFSSQSSRYISSTQRKLSF